MLHSRLDLGGPRSAEPASGGGAGVLKLARPRVIPLWMIPSIYIVASIAGGFIFPRLEHALLPDLAHDMSAGAAISAFSAVASGMMAFTGVVFAVAFVVVQFSAIAYSPRLVVLFAENPRLYHTLGLFFATFAFSLAALTWTDRNGSGVTPLISTYVVGLLLVASMLAFARMIQSVHELQIQNVLQVIGARGREVIAAMFPTDGAGRFEELARVDAPSTLPPVRRVFTYSGAPLSIAKFDLDRLVAAAKAADAVIVLECAVGDTLVNGAVLLRVHGGRAPVNPRALRHAVHAAASRTFEQDPKYALRLLVDVAIRALSPAINDPTTAVQALDQIEDLLRRLGHSRLEAGYAHDETGALRVLFPAPTWVDYLSLAFDEIRQFGAPSLQVTRRMRAALTGLAADLGQERRTAVLQYLHHLDDSVRTSAFDSEDRASGMREDRQGLGLARPQALR